MALMGNFVFQNVVKRRNAVGRDEQQRVAKIVNVAYLALRVGLDGNGASQP